MKKKKRKEKRKWLGIDSCVTNNRLRQRVLPRYPRYPSDNS